MEALLLNNHAYLDQFKFLQRLTKLHLKFDSNSNAPVSEAILESILDSIQELQEEIHMYWELDCPIGNSPSLGYAVEFMAHSLSIAYNNILSRSN